MHTLVQLSAEPSYKSSRDAIHLAFGLVRHYIGRLGHHFRAVKALLCCAPRLSDLLYDYQVCGVFNLPKFTMPQPDHLTSLKSILIWMLLSNSPDLEHYQEALVDMDLRYQLSRRFLENYIMPDLKPCVYAEIQVLE
jgi:hypothetical protein